MHACIRTLPPSEFAMTDFDVFLHDMPTGLAVCGRDGNLLMRNRKLCDIFSSHDDSVLAAKVCGVIKRCKKLRIDGLAAIDHDVKIDGRIFAVRLHDAGDMLYVFFNEKNEDILFFEEIKKTESLSNELKELFRTCTNDTIWITDAEGNTIMAGKKNAEHLGVDIRDLEGKNVRDLEMQNIFSPSVTLKVMETKKREVLLQRTRTGRHCVAIGSPYFDKNGDLFRIVSITRDISRQFKVGNLLASAAIMHKADGNSSVLRNFITANEQMLSLLHLIKVLAAMDSTVLIEGETGSGKGVAASLIHRMSRRTENVFLEINCGAINPDLINAELFGYTPGAFTGALKDGKKGLIEAADGGTLFLDEIGELPQDQQMKLLEFLQDKTIMRIGGRRRIPVDVRIIAATNKNLEEQVRRRAFRQDLFYRLNVIPIHMPPLRQRKEDIPLLVKHFSSSMAKKRGFQKEFSLEAMDALRQYDWPGNVRELEHLVEKLYTIQNRAIITELDILDILPSTSEEDSPRFPDRVEIGRLLPLRLAVAAVERKLLQIATERCVTEEEIARLLGGSQPNISRKIRRYGLTTTRGKNT